MKWGGRNTWEEARPSPAEWKERLANISITGLINEFKSIWVVPFWESIFKRIKYYEITTTKNVKKNSTVNLLEDNIKESFFYFYLHAYICVQCT